ncbi:DUF2169 family type VI secretion system accessory protein [Polyangium mundeleinium]|uniref:DUF2169 domain-containing protein n=1 Tax=Polyangium mundeleinium TaxID=2995306 RepID=A0ABT5EP60_9BACT|nr:DUF2169 domain-containing protein [Polyangium mundeleinium]MDC0742511.1 DUF2169 domain-containing protein [Polyangium mundeleinium]
MKIVKPQRLGLLTHTFENDGQSFFVLTAMAYFAFDAPNKLLHEVALWTMIPEELGADTPFDTGMTKTRGEVVVTGKAHAPAGAKVPARAVKLRVLRGERALVDKELYVIGDRRWELGGPTAPEPFSEMPVTWDRAFGGAGFEWNPIGKGFAPTEANGKQVHLLPNLEDPKRLVTKKGDRPQPVGLGPVDQTWPQRMRKAGTYDAEWLETRFPGVAADIDWTFYNVAPEDQQIEKYFTGSEVFEVHGMHPERPTSSVRLPELRARLFIVQRTKDGEELREAASRIDTVWLFPNKERGVAIFRGVLEIAEDDAADVLHVIAAFERPGEVRPTSHYLSVLEKRKDKKRGAMHALVDADLMPVPPEGEEAPSDEDWNDMVAVARTEGLMQKRLEARADKQIAAARAEIVAAGLDPSALDAEVAKKREPPPKDVNELVAVFDRAEKEAEEARKQAETSLAELEAEARQALGTLGVDYEAAVRKSKEKGGGPPKFSAEKELDGLRAMVELGKNAGTPLKDAEAKLASPEFVAALHETERRLFEAYRRYTHLFPPASGQDEEGNRALRAALEEARAKGESLAGRDFTGADLSGIDLSGMNLHRALLEKVNLAGANLSGADLTDATLARATLDGANLSGAKLRGANLGQARLRETRLDGGIDFTGAVFYQADLGGAKLRGASLVSAQLLETKLDGVDFGGAKIDKALFLKSSLAGASFTNASLVEAIFLEVGLDGAKFAAATLTDATFVKAKGQGVSFAGASLQGARIVLECAFPQADFRGARFRRTCMRGVAFPGADFTGAEMPEVDLSECDLSGAKMRGVQADGSLFIRTDLSNADLVAATMKMAILQKAKLHGTDLRGANLFRSDMAKVKLDAKTNVKDALVTQARVIPERRKREGTS